MSASGLAHELASTIRAELQRAWTRIDDQVVLLESVGARAAEMIGTLNAGNDSGALIDAATNIQMLVGHTTRILTELTDVAGRLAVLAALRAKEESAVADDTDENEDDAGD